MMLFGPLFLEKCVFQKRTLFRPDFMEILIREIPPRKKYNFHPKNRPLRSHRKIVFHKIPKNGHISANISLIFSLKSELKCNCWQFENLNVILRTSPPWIIIYKFYDNIIKKIRELECHYPKSENLNVKILLHFESGLSSKSFTTRSPKLRKFL